MRYSPLVVLLCSCSFDTSGIAKTFDAKSDIDAPAIDAMVDAAIDADQCPGKALAIEPHLFDKCDVPAPVAWSIAAGSTWLIDTDTGDAFDQNNAQVSLSLATVNQTAAPEILVIAVPNFVVPPQSVIRATGKRALAIVSYGDITIDGVIDLSGHGSERGAGANHSQRCVLGSGAPGAPYLVPGKAIGGSGGGGAGHGRGGGASGKVTNGTASIAAPGGGTYGAADLKPLTSGCDGGRGGDTGGGDGGGGGGAIDLVASGSISIAGLVFAGGGGGGGAFNDAGGGGGGSGGGILIESVVGTVVDGTVNALGGAGGEGGYAGTTAAGEDARADGMAAAGGDTVDHSGEGGNGGAVGADGLPGAGAKRNSGDPTRGGGGGGGGQGRVYVIGSLQTGANARLDPPPTP